MSYNPQSWTQDILVQLSATDTDSLVVSATYALGYIPMNGALANKTVAQLPVVGSIALASTGNLSAINFVITGVTLAGATVTETLAGPNNTSVTSALNTYWRITSIVPSAGSASTINVGISGSATAITNAGTVTAATPLSITGSTFGSDTDIRLINPALLSFTTGANETANTYTVYGVDLNGNTVTATVVGPNAGAANISTAFAQVLWISQQDAGSGTLIVGNAAVTYTQWIPIDKNANQFAVEYGVGLSAGASMNYTVQFGLISQKLNVQIVQNDDILASQTTSGSTYLYNEPFDAARLYINSWTSGTAAFLVRPSGLASAGYPPIQI